MTTRETQGIIDLNVKVGRHRQLAVPAEDGTISGHEAEDRRIGARIRNLRKERNLTIEALADASGLSVGMLSQLERGLTTPTVRSLRELGAALSVSISWFFSQAEVDDSEEARHIVRRNARSAMTLTPTGIHKELLTPSDPSLVEVFHLTVLPGGTSGDDFYNHRGEKAGYLISGTLELMLADRSYSLAEGDSFRFASEIEHRFENRGPEPARVLWVVAGSRLGVEQ